MEEIVYLSVRIVCACYILYNVWEQKSNVRKVCDLLYMKGMSVRSKKEKLETALPELPDEMDVMGDTCFVYLDENVGKTVAPYMSQPLETTTGYIGEDEDIPEEEVECKLPLEEMKILKEEQKELDEISPEVDVVSQAVTPADLDNAGNVLFGLGDANKDEDKSRRAALTLHAIRETDLFEIFSSQVESRSVIENLMGRYLDENGNPLPARKIRAETQTTDNWKQYL